MSAARYLEQLTPAWWVWTATLGLGVGFGLILVPVGLLPAAATAVGSAAALSAVLIRSTPTVGLQNQTVRAGRAHLPIAAVAQVEVLDAPGVRHACGPGLDARAYLCVRGWITTAVRVQLSDPTDPTPYWVVSTRHPETFAAAIRAAQALPPDPDLSPNPEFPTHRPTDR